MKVFTNIVTTKSILDFKKIIKNEQVVRVNSKKALSIFCLAVRQRDTNNLLQLRKHSVSPMLVMVINQFIL